MIRFKEIETSILFNFANNNISSCLSIFLLIIDVWFLIPAVIAQTGNAEIRTKEVKAETETNPVTVEDEISKSL